MDDFSSPGQANGYGLAPSKANFIRPGKRPLSSMSPTIARDLSTGAVRLVVGASGGPRIITSVAQVLLAVAARGVPAPEAVGAPRVHHQLLPDYVSAEDFTMLDGGRVHVPDSVWGALTRRGHQLKPRGSEVGVVQLVLVDAESGLLTAVSDRRKDGAPAGF